MVYYTTETVMMPKTVTSTEYTIRSKEDNIIIINNINVDGWAFKSNACTFCSNNPANGGSGVCHCIMGSKDRFIY